MSDSPTSMGAKTAGGLSVAESAMGFAMTSKEGIRAIIVKRMVAGSECGASRCLKQCLKAS